MRKDKLVQGEIYHICNKSIANFGIFKDPVNAERYIKLLDYYNTLPHPRRFSHATNAERKHAVNLLTPKENSIVKFICYCIMPDHYHILLKILSEYSISKYISDIENSFTRYFNIKFDRKGPLWQSEFRAVRIKTETQLLHVTRYIHLNPTTSKLVNKPEDWKWSSYRDYIENPAILQDAMNELTIKNPRKYKKFCEDRIDYQKRLKEIKKILLE